jgi:cytoskeletal protein CcmA (bactofilin family)
VSTASPILFDGYTSVRALRRAGVPSGEARTQPSRTRPPGPGARRKPDPDALKDARIGHTAVPLRHEIVCYQCGYAFVLQGRIEKPLCPKCREFLDATDRVIEAEWSQNVKTVGTVDIRAHAVVRGAEIVGRDIILAGDAREGALHAFRCLELRPGADFDFGHVAARDLRVRAGASLVLTQVVSCRNLELEGEVRAAVSATDCVTIRAGGMLVGEVRCPHLVVEEGGGLKADVQAGGIGR